MKPALLFFFASAAFVQMRAVVLAQASGGITANYRSVWTSVTAYAANDLAMYAPTDTLYQALRANNGVTPGTETANWAQVSFFLTTPSGSRVAPGSPLSEGFEGYWNSANSYTVGQFVTYGTTNQLFQSLTNNSNAIPGTDSNWAAVAYVLTPYSRGTYSITSTYAPLDTVSFNGAYYQSLTINTGSIPPASGSTADWTLTSGTSNGPTFLSSTAPASATWHAGSNATFATTFVPVQGFTGTITPAITGLPSGVTATCLPATVTTSGSTTCTLSASPTAARGAVPAFFSGSGGLTPLTTSLTILAPGFISQPVDRSFPSPVNLSAVGTDDWEVFAPTSGSTAPMTPTARKAAGNLLGSTGSIGGPGDAGFFPINGSISFTWTDASGTVSGSSGGHIGYAGNAGPMTFTAAADFTPRTITFYLQNPVPGGQPNRPTLTVSVGGGSPVVHPFTSATNGAVTVQYQGSAMKQKATFVLSGSQVGFGAIALTH